MQGWGAVQGGGGRAQHQPRPPPSALNSFLTNEATRSSLAAAAARQPKALSTEEVRAHKFQLKPENIAAWWQMLGPFLLNKVPELEAVLTCTQEEWDTQLKLEPEPEAIRKR